MDYAPYFIGAALSSALYSWLLELSDKRYEPDWTWLVVMGGVALTGGWVALSLWHVGPPREVTTPLGGAWWLWRHTFWMFWATAVPVIAWQAWQARARLRAAWAYLMGRRRDYEREAALALRGGESPEADD